MLAEAALAEPCSFVDVQEMHRKSPETFDAPSPARLAAIGPGSFVKVSCENERFWVQVTSVSDAKICGRVDNAVGMPGLRLGSMVCFEKRHVYDVFY